MNAEEKQKLKELMCSQLYSQEYMSITPKFEDLHKMMNEVPKPTPAYVGPDGTEYSVDDLVNALNHMGEEVTKLRELNDSHLNALKNVIVGLHPDHFHGTATLRMIVNNYLDTHALKK